MTQSSLNLVADLNDTEADKTFLQFYLRNLNTALPCKITEADNMSLRFTLEPLINYLTTTGTAIAPPILFDVPMSAIQGGVAGIWIEPQVGDIVQVLFQQRDWTNLKRVLLNNSDSVAAVNPPTKRILDLADGVMAFLIPSKRPEVYVKIIEDEIELFKANSKVTLNGSQISLEQGNDVSIVMTDSQIEASVGSTTATLTTTTITATASTSATITAPTITLNGNVQINGTLNGSATADFVGIVTAADFVTVAAGTTFTTHIHPKGGGSETQPPTPGS